MDSNFASHTLCEIHKHLAAQLTTLCTYQHPSSVTKMVDLKSLLPQLNKTFTETSSGSTVCSYTSNIGGDGPILTLIHGYPQSAFE